MVTQTMLPYKLEYSDYSAIYNALSFVMASMGASTIYFFFRTSFAYSPLVHSFHARRDRVVLLPPCRLYGAATLRAHHSGRAVA